MFIVCTSFVIIVLLLLCAFNVDDLTTMLRVPFQSVLPLPVETTVPGPPSPGPVS